MASYRTVILFLLLIPSLAFGTRLVITGSGNVDDRSYYSDLYESYNADGNTVDTLFLGYNASVGYYASAFTFDNVTVPKNATVQSCSLKVKTKRAGTVLDVGIDVTIWFTQSDNATAPPTTATDAYIPSGTTWSYSRGSNWTADLEILINLSSTPIQNIFARSGWASGNSVTVIMSDISAYSDVQMVLYALDSYAHTLIINYTDPVPAPSRGTGRFGKSTSGAYLNDR